MMLMINFDELSEKFRAQRCFILSLANTPLTDDQHKILRDVSRMNHEIAQMLHLNVPSMQELTKQASEIMMLNQMYALEVPAGGDEKEEGGGGGGSCA